MWKEINSPSGGIIHDIRKSTRFRYFDELKKIQEKSRSYILTNKTNDFWQCMWKIKHDNTSSSNFIDGVSGKKVCDVFKYEYVRLYQTCIK